MQRDVPFMHVVAGSAVEGTPEAGDRLSLAAPVRAWNRGLREAAHGAFAYIGKLDGDVELPPDYYERLLARFAVEPQLGIAGGYLIEPRGSKWRRLSIPEYHVHGALKLYSHACYEAIGGIQERLGWDTIDETYARMKGFATRSYRELLAVHHRPAGSADGRLRGYARHAECAYIAHYGPVWIGLRSLKVASRRPVVLSGVAFLFGYLRAAIRRTPKVDDREFRRYVRRELRRRMLLPRSLAFWGGRRA
jgi:poly-beta-1,6-N-acetyl-D-glucosamine synthase